MEPPTGSTGSELLAAFGGVSSPPSPLRGKGVANPAEEEAQPAIPPRGESLPSVADENANMEKPGQSRDAEVAEIIARFRAMGASVPSSPLPATPSKAQAAVAQGKVDLLLNFAPGVALIRLNNPSKRCVGSIGLPSSRL